MRSFRRYALPLMGIRGRKIVSAAEVIDEATAVLKLRLRPEDREVFKGLDGKEKVNVLVHNERLTFEQRGVRRTV